MSTWQPFYITSQLWAFALLFTETPAAAFLAFAAAGLHLAISLVLLRDETR